jgi:site-specific DNA recombinase
MERGTKKTKAAIYVRVSTEEQVREGYSVPAQIEVLSQYCKLYNLEIYKIYMDLGISGKSVKNRRGLNEMLEDADKNLFDVVLVWKTNRLARNLKDLLVLVDRLERNNVAFISYSEHFDTLTPTGRMTMQILGSIGEFERNTIVENVKMGLRQRLNMGKTIGRIAFGYRSVNKELQIVDAEARIVKRMFEIAYSLPDAGYKKIAFMLNSEGYRTRMGKLWSGDTVEDILKNPIYIGKLRYDVRHNKKGENYFEVDGMHKSIIDQNTFYKVQERLNSIPDCIKNIKGENDSFLVGLLRCPYCGGGTVRRNSRGFLYYQCLSYHRYGKTACKGFSISAKSIEAVVMEKIDEFTHAIKDILHLVKTVRIKNNSENLHTGNIIEGIQKGINALEEKKERYFLMFEDRSIDRELFLDRIKSVSAQLDQLKKRKEEFAGYAGSGASRLSDRQIAEHVQNFLPVFKKADVNEKKRWIRLLIKEILLTEDKKIKRFVFRFPLEEL